MAKKKTMEEQKKNYSKEIAIAWLVVTIPALWGVVNTAIQAFKLF